MSETEKKFLTTSEAAQRTGIPEGSLNNMAWRKVGPRYFKVGKRRLYDCEDLDNFIKSNPIRTIDQG